MNQKLPVNFRENSEGNTALLWDVIDGFSQSCITQAQLPRAHEMKERTILGSLTVEKLC